MDLHGYGWIWSYTAQSSQDLPGDHGLHTPWLYKFIYFWPIAKCWSLLSVQMVKKKKFSIMIQFEMVCHVSMRIYII